MTAVGNLRRSVVQLYKELQFMGREYPAGADYFQTKCKAAFLKNKDETDPEKIQMLIDRGRFVQKEIEALYGLRKYRAMKNRYYDQDEMDMQSKRIENFIKQL